MNTTFSITAIFKEAWALTKKHLRFLVLTNLVFMVVIMVLNRTGRHDSFSLILFIATIIVSVIYGVGMFRIAKSITDGAQPDLNMFKISDKTFFSVLWSGIITGFFVVLGFILLIIPGIFLLMRLSLSKYIVIDQDTTGWESVKESYRMTRGYFWKIFGFMILSGIIMLISAIPFGLGLIFSVPWLLLSYVILYKTIRANYVAHTSVSTNVAEAPVVTETESHS